MPLCIGYLGGAPGLNRKVGERFSSSTDLSGFLPEATCEWEAAAPIIQKFPKEHSRFAGKFRVSGERR